MEGRRATNLEGREGDDREPILKDRDGKMR